MNWLPFYLSTHQITKIMMEQQLYFKSQQIDLQKHRVSVAKEKLKIDFSESAHLRKDVAEEKLKILNDEFMDLFFEYQKLRL